MKNVLKSILAVMALMVVSLGFVACSNDDENESVSLKGKWYSVSENQDEFMIIKDDNSVVCYRKDRSEQQLWKNIQGTITTAGNNITIDFGDGNCASGTFVLEENKLSINTNYGMFVYTRLAYNYNLEGEWVIYDIATDIVPIKDEIKLPSGTMADGSEVPSILKTSQLSGQFINFAINQYLRNIKFNGNQMSYTVLKGEDEVSLTKEYTLGDIDITIKGNVAGHKIEAKMMMAQAVDEKSIAIMLTKENLADLFVGYSIMLAEGGLAAQPDAAELEEFKQAFADAFTYFDVTLSLRRP